MNENIVFMDKDDANYIVSFPIPNLPTPSKLRIWVAYEKGGYSYHEYKKLKRGYYLYISIEEPCSIGRILLCGGENYRVLLGEVPRKSKRAYREFSEKAEINAKKIITKLYKNTLKIDWENGSSSTWSGCGNGLGFYADFYKIIE